MPNQQDFAQGQMNGLGNMMADPNLLRALQQFMGSGQFQSMLPGWAAPALTSQMQGQVGMGLNNNLANFQTKPLSLQDLLNTGNQVLGGAEQRQAGQMGNQGLAQGLSMGLSNPMLLANRQRNQAYQNFADQYGQLAMNAPKEAFNSQLAANQANFGNRLGVMGMQNQLAQYLPQGGDIGSSIGNFLGGAAGSFLGPFGGALGKRLGGG